MLDFKNYKNIEIKTTVSSGEMALSILHGSNSYKITLNKALVENLQLVKKADAEQQKTVPIELQILICGNELAIGKFIRKDATVFKGKLTNGTVTFYSTALAHAVEAGMRHQIPKNRTLRFENITIDTNEKGNLVAVITCTK